MKFWEKIVGFLIVLAVIIMSPVFMLIALLKSAYEIFMYGFKNFVEKGKDTEE